MSTDKKTIGLTADNQRVMEHLVERKLFKDGIAAAKFAMAVAINSGSELRSAEGAGTIWNVGSFDTENELKNLITVLFPDTTTPYRLVEDLINSGFKMIGRELARKADMNPVELLETFSADNKKSRGK